MATKNLPIRTQYENRVLRAARKYARMKLHGTYVENDRVNIVAHSDRETLVRHFLEELARTSVELLDAMSIDEIDGTLVE